MKSREVAASDAVKMAVEGEVRRAREDWPGDRDCGGSVGLRQSDGGTEKIQEGTACDLIVVGSDGRGHPNPCVPRSEGCLKQEGDVAEWNVGAMAGADFLGVGIASLVWPCRGIVGVGRQVL